MSNTETVGLTIAFWDGAEDLEWEVEVMLWKDGEPAGRRIGHSEGHGALRAHDHRAAIILFERLLAGIQQARGVQLQFPGIDDQPAT